MNLLQQHWLKAIVNGQSQTIAVSDIGKSEVSDLAFTRQDFNGTVYQLLIGLLQTSIAPKNTNHWYELYYEPPTSAELTVAFAPFDSAFELLPADGPAFMQDLTMAVGEGESKPIAALLIEAPGGKTIKDNTDHFTKRGFADKMCPNCAAAALYCLQCSAPGGGVGHRTSLRGGGGLTTLVKPEGQSTLWQKLWLNVMPKDTPDLKTDHPQLAAIFPWLAPTKTSEKKGSEILPDQVNPLQMYWGMPRRIRLERNTVVEGCCDICGEHSMQNFTQFVTKNYGPNYGDGWLHFLTPYRFDLKAAKPPLSVKGKQGGLTYKDWMGIAIGDERNGEKPAAVVAHFLEQKRFKLDRQDRNYQLWCFGYDMDNMKARCWYDNTLPIVAIADEHKPLVLELLAEYQEFAKDTVSVIRQSVKQAWFSRPKDAKGDTSKIDLNFWQATEADFFALVKQVVKNIEDRTSWVESDKLWKDKMTNQLNRQFEHWTLDKFGADRDLPRIMQARQSLHKVFFSLKSYKAINGRITTAKKEKA